MLLIQCPWCGPRDENEFSYGGEANLLMPSEPESVSDSAWAKYLFFRKNTKGAHLEQWAHSYGCRRWFNVKRNTISYKIIDVYKLNDCPTEDSR